MPGKGLYANIHAKRKRGGKMKKKPMKGKKVVGKRKKLDIDKDGKLTKKDFAMLRNKKKARA